MGVTYIGNIIVSAVSPQAIGRATEEIRVLLRQRHRSWAGPGRRLHGPLAAGDASRRKPDEPACTVLLWSIAGMSLLVGGIGIMNIMLVSVTERTREIGIRHGHRRAAARDIQAQFLVEAVALAVVGGAVGVGARDRRSSASSRASQAGPVVDPAAGDRHGGRVLRPRRRVLRVLSRAQGLAPRPDRERCDTNDGKAFAGGDLSGRWPFVPAGLPG